jgi:hypothetical protein
VHQAGDGHVVRAEAERIADAVVLAAARDVVDGHVGRRAREGTSSSSGRTLSASTSIIPKSTMQRCMRPGASGGRGDLPDGGFVDRAVRRRVFLGGLDDVAAKAKVSVARSWKGWL